MFSVSVVDHVRLNFGHVVQNYTVHARAAERFAALGFKARIAVLGLISLATALMVIGLFAPSRGYQVAAAVMAGLALAGHTAYVAGAIESRVFAHRLIANRLWLMCEQYRSLLAEIQDSLLDDGAILERREALIRELHAIYEQVFSVDQQAFESQRQRPATTEPGGISDQQIDEFLPPSFRKRADVRSVGTSSVSH